MKEDTLFGQIVLANKMITEEQLNDALETQRSAPEHRLLGTILLSKCYINQEQLRAVLDLQKKLFPKPATGPQEKKDDVAFAFLAYENKYVTIEQIYKSLKTQLWCLKKGLFFRLSEVMVNHHFITPETAQKITGLQKAKIVECLQCHSKFNTVGLKTGFKFRCKSCSNILVVNGNGKEAAGEVSH